MNKLDEARKQIDALDKQMAELFVKRMEVVKEVSQCKKENSLPVVNKEREAVVINNNAQNVDEEYRKYYVEFLFKTIDVSCKFQNALLSENTNEVKTLFLYNSVIVIKNNVLSEANKYFNLKRKVLIVSDDGVPNKYVETLKKQCQTPFTYIIKHGESSKSLTNFEAIHEFLIKNNFTRTDCIVALGGGVVGDLAGFVASTYMRGITYYNVPTTLLSQVDSSIGGKTAIDMGNTKNIVGAFYQPSVVLIDKSLLVTLDSRLLNEGLVEAFKMGITNDKSLVDIIMNSNNIYSDLDAIIYRALKVKQSIVEQDEKESGLRKILNYGHTFGHAIEEMENGNLYHGECVGLGMLYLSSPKVVELINQFLDKYSLPKNTNYDKQEMLSYIKRDKKADGNKVSVVYAKDIEQIVIKKVEMSKLEENLMRNTICQMF